MCRQPMPFPLLFSAAVDIYVAAALLPYTLRLVLLLAVVAFPPALCPGVALGLLRAVPPTLAVVAPGRTHWHAPPWNDEDNIRYIRRVN